VRGLRCSPPADVGDDELDDLAGLDIPGGGATVTGERGTPLPYVRKSFGVPSV
jgi:hypothetical protein